eukprot:4206490-Pleurochrysis_carterae.AAC.1
MSPLSRLRGRLLRATPPRCSAISEAHPFPSLSQREGGGGRWCGAAKPTSRGLREQSSTAERPSRYQFMILRSQVHSHEASERHADGW